MIVVLAVAAVVSTLANQRFRDAVSGEPDLVIANRVALEMADFDRSPAGNARRCDLRQQFFSLKNLGPLALIDSRQASTPPPWPKPACRSA